MKLLSQHLVLLCCIIWPYRTSEWRDQAEMYYKMIGGESSNKNSPFYSLKYGAWEHGRFYLQFSLSKLNGAPIKILLLPFTRLAPYCGITILILDFLLIVCRCLIQIQYRYQTKYWLITSFDCVIIIVF